MVCTFFNDSWEQHKLNELCNALYVGKSFTNYLDNETGHYIVMDMGSVNLDGNRIENKKTNLCRDVLLTGDLVMPKDDIGGGLIIGKTAYIHLENKYVLGDHVFRIRPINVNPLFMHYLINGQAYNSAIKLNVTGSAQLGLRGIYVENSIINHPTTIEEQSKISNLFNSIDNLITLHQRECIINGGEMKQINKNTLLVDYYEQWINVYKEGAIRNVTMKKYRLTLLWLKKITPKLKLFKLDRIEYQNILNIYALEHERQTTMDFHHQLKGAILDAVDEGYIERDPTRKVIIKGKTPRAKKIKYLNQYELHTLLKNLDLSQGVNFDWLILIIAKTGMRFSEAIALTPKDFDFSHQTLSINKTWDYKESGTFQPTKNKSSVRKIQIDWMVVSQFSTLIKDLPENEPIFVKKPIYNSTINDILERHCKKNNIPIITVHGLRHTHASLLLFAGVSIASVAQRLGHASMTTTQKTYLHIIQELENKDVDLVMRSLSGLC